MQSQPTPVEFLPQEHTDFVFQVQVTNWPALLATIAAAGLTLGFVVRWYRRRGRPRNEP